MTKSQPLGKFENTIDVKIGSKCRALCIRPFAGDIFILYEVLAFEAYRLPRAELDPNAVRVIVDCGANIGISALYFASRYPNARIFSIEPDPENFRLLCKNVASEPRITPHCAAVVGAPRSTVWLSQDRPAWGNAVTASGSGSGIEVTAVTLDQFMSAFQLTHIDLLKVDIEGAEEEVFARADFLDDVTLVVVELHGDYNLQRFQHDIAAKGFLASSPSGQESPDAVVAKRRHA